jgi:hypothetical protein
MSKIELPDLFALTKSLDIHHLGHAIDLYRMAVEQSAKNSDLSYHLAMSSIIHSFCGMESVINRIGYNLFFNEDSIKYIVPAKRDFLLKRLIKSWDNVAITEKLQFVLYYSGKFEIPRLLENQLRELNNYRNWIVHGFAFKETYLIDRLPVSESEYASGLISRGTLVDQESSVDWSTKFPVTKFNAIDSIKLDDAKLALSIVFTVCQILSATTDTSITILTCYPKREYKDIPKEEFDIMMLIEQK